MAESLYGTPKDKDRAVLLIDNWNAALKYKEVYIDGVTVAMCYIPDLATAKKVIKRKFVACTTVGACPQDLEKFLRIKCKEVTVIWRQEQLHTEYRALRQTNNLGRRK